MDSKKVTQQIRVINSVTKQATSSKEASLKFLKDAGIIKSSSKRIR
jgi:hypothetical protein